jgi:hypothetical protein
VSSDNVQFSNVENGTFASEDYVARPASRRRMGLGSAQSGRRGVIVLPLCRGKVDSLSPTEPSVLIGHNVSKVHTNPSRGSLAFATWCHHPTKASAADWDGANAANRTEVGTRTTEVDVSYYAISYTCNALENATRWKMLRGFTAAQTNRILGPFPASRIPRYTMPKLLIDPWRDARIVCHGISDCLDAFTHLRQSYLAKITKQPTGDMIHGFVTRAKRDENVFPTLVIYLSSRASDISGQ